MKRVKSNLLMQDVYLRDVYPKKDVDMSFKECSYLDSRFETQDDDLKFVCEEKPYPITPEYVDSFNDESAVLANKQMLMNDPESLRRIRPGLGDVADVQALLSDSEKIRKLYDELSLRIAEAQKAGKLKKEDKDEVKDNE